MWKMREITNVLLFAFKIVCYLASWILLHHIYSGDNWCGGWQLMWPFRFVAVPVCGHFGLWPFRSVAVSVCGRFGLWPFRFVAVSVCGRSGLWPFRFVAVSVCGRFGCGRFGLWPLWPVTNKFGSTKFTGTCGWYDRVPQCRYMEHG